MQATAFDSASPRTAVRFLPLTPLRTAEYDSRLRPPLPGPSPGLSRENYLLRGPPSGDQDGFPGSAQPLVIFFPGPPAGDLPHALEPRSVKAAGVRRCAIQLHSAAAATSARALRGVGAAIHEASLLPWWLALKSATTAIAATMRAKKYINTTKYCNYGLQCILQRRHERHRARGFPALPAAAKAEARPGEETVR